MFYRLLLLTFPRNALACRPDVGRPLRRLCHGLCHSCQREGERPCLSADCQQPEPSCLQELDSQDARTGPITSPGHRGGYGPPMAKGNPSLSCRCPSDARTCACHAAGASSVECIVTREPPSQSFWTSVSYMLGNSMSCSFVPCIFYRDVILHVAIYEDSFDLFAFNARVSYCL